MNNQIEYRLTCLDEKNNETWHVWEFQQNRWICVRCEIRSPLVPTDCLVADPEQVKHMVEEITE